MTPEEKVLIERSIRLTEENNKILKKIQRRMRWAVLWGFLKVLIIVVPLVVGYLFLEPYIGEVKETYDDMQQIRDTQDQYQDVNPDLIRSFLKKL